MLLYMVDFLALSALQVALVLEQERMLVWEWRLKRLCLVTNYVLPSLWAAGHLGIHYSTSPSAEGYYGLLIYLCPCSAFPTLGATFWLIAYELWQVSKTFGTGSKLKKRVETIAKACAVFGAAWPVLIVMTVVVFAVPYLRLRQSLVFLSVWLPQFLLCGCFPPLYDLHLSIQDNQQRRNAVQPAITSVREASLRPLPVPIQSVIAANKKNSLTTHVLEPAVSGVSLEFLKHFAAEFNIDPKATGMEQLCEQHVKGLTKDSGSGKSYSLAELLVDGKDAQGHRLVSYSTHMLSYSWKYTLSLLIDVLGKFEDGHRVQGVCYYYFMYVNKQTSTQAIN
jgi:hypothetical protein